MIAKLILVFCLSTNPTACKEWQPVEASCYASAPQQLAVEWLRDHPGYELVKIKCQFGRREHTKQQPLIYSR